MLVNVAVQLDREPQRHPCLNTPRGRGDQTGDINVPRVCRGGFFAAGGSGLAGRERGRYGIEKQGKMHRAGILQSMHAELKTPKHALGFASEKRSLEDLIREHRGGIEGTKSSKFYFRATCGNLTVKLCNSPVKQEELQSTQLVNIKKHADRTPGYLILTIIHQYNYI